VGAKADPLRDVAQAIRAARLELARD
jgi:hypothetical protein